MKPFPLTTDVFLFLLKCFVVLLVGLFLSSNVFAQPQLEAKKTTWKLVIDGPFESGNVMKLPEPILCLPCIGDNNGTGSGSIIDVRTNGVGVAVHLTEPLDPMWKMTGIYFGVGGSTYRMDLSNDDELLKEYAGAHVARLVIDDPEGVIDDQQPLFLRFTLELVGTGSGTRVEAQILFDE